MPVEKQEIKGPKIKGPLLNKELHVNAQGFNYFIQRNYKPQNIAIEGYDAIMLRKYLVQLLQKPARNLTWDTRNGEKLSNKDILLFGEVLKKLVKLKKFTFIEKIVSKLTLYGYQQLAKMLSKLSRLNELTASLRPNNPSEKFFNQIERSVKYLQKLERLNINLIRSDKADTQDLSCLAHSIKRLSLTQLSYCFSPRDENINNLINMLPKLSKLASINFDFHLILVTPPLLSAIASVIPQLKSLTKLSLNFQGCNHFPDQEWQEMMGNMTNLSQLTSLELKLGKYLTAYQLNNIATLVAQLNHLTSLSLSLSAVSNQPNRADDARQEILHNIAQLTKLSKLELSLHFSKENPDGLIKTLAGTLRSFNLKAKSLKLSFLDVKELSNDNLHELAQALRKLSLLTTCTISLSQCPAINKIGISALTEGISKLRCLTELTLQVYNCEITDKYLGQLGKLLRKLAHLTRLSIKFFDTASVTKTGLDSLTYNLSNLPYLTELSIVLFRTDPAITQAAEAKFIQAVKKRYESGKLRVFIQNKALTY
jgi:hypothetical protein